MRRLATLLALTLAVPALAADVKELTATRYTGHFERNDSGLKGEASFLSFADLASFEKVFGSAFMPKSTFVKKDTFDTHVVVAVIHRGTKPWEYTVDKVSADDGVLTVKYTATAKDAGGTATFASPLILSVEKGKYRSVVFIENGKEVGQADFPK